MNYYIPLSYKLKKKEIDIDESEIIIDDKKRTITYNHIILFLNKNDVIYKISSLLKLEIILDILNVSEYKYLIIKKIYYFLIIKYLFSFSFQIKNESNYNNCFYYNNNDEYINKIIRTREYCICSNSVIIGTSSLNTNICLIIANKSFNKILFAIIDNNCDLECLYDIIPNIYNNSRFEDIKITIIGGSIENINVLIYVYVILKNLRLSKFIYHTYIIKNKSLSGIKYNTCNNNICFINNNIKEFNNHDYYSGLNYKY